MRFLLVTTGRHYGENQKIELESLGFEFHLNDRLRYTGRPYTMDKDKQVFIEMESLQELVDFSDKWGQIIVNNNEIEIYDDFRE
jgi:hypothetical protein